MEKMTLADRVAAVSENANKRFQTLQKIQAESLKLLLEIEKTQDTQAALLMRKELETLDKVRDWLTTP